MMEPKTCAECEGTYLPKSKSVWGRSMFCGNACKIANWKSRNPEAATAYRLSEAAKAKAAADARRNDPARIRAASIGALLRAMRQVGKRKALIERAKKKLHRVCVDCGQGFMQRTHWGRTQFRCESCQSRRKATIQRTHRKAAKQFRKALARGANGGERFNPLWVFERDKWTCQLCGIKTPKKLRGTHSHNAPELDHIVPVSLGGQHARHNTQCACRSCNQAKGAKPLGQLHLAIAA